MTISGGRINVSDGVRSATFAAISAIEYALGSGNMALCIPEIVLLPPLPWPAPAPGRTFHHSGSNRHPRPLRLAGNRCHGPVDDPKATLTNQGFVAVRADPSDDAKGHHPDPSRPGSVEQPDESISRRISTEGFASFLRNEANHIFASDKRLQPRGQGRPDMRILPADRLKWRRGPRGSRRRFDRACLRCRR